MNLDSLLFSEKGDLLGKIDDVFGNVHCPFYSILMDVYLLRLLKDNKDRLLPGMRIYAAVIFSK